MSTVNHVGLAVADLDRAQAFYEAVLGFTESRRMSIPDAFTADLLGVEPPVGLTAVYLELGGFTLELLHFDRPGNPPARERPFPEPGLTHLSLTVDDVAASCALVTEHGGTVLSSNPVVAMVRDPDGQVLELLAPGAMG